MYDMFIQLKNMILFSASVIALIFIIQIEFKLIPLFLSFWSVEVSIIINRLVSSLSQGFLISMFFYLLVVAIPEYSKAKAIRSIITPRLKTIVNMLHQSINYMSLKYNLPEADLLVGIKVEDFSAITRLNAEPRNFNYKIKNNAGSWTSFGSGNQTELSHFAHERKTVINKIDEILHLPNLQFEDEELIKCLAELRDSWFYSGVKSFSENHNKYNISVNNFSEGVCDYYKSYRVLKKFITPTELKPIENT